MKIFLLWQKRIRLLQIINRIPNVYVYNVKSRLVGPGHPYRVIPNVYVYNVKSRLMGPGHRYRVISGI